MACNKDLKNWGAAHLRLCYNVMVKDPGNGCSFRNIIQPGEIERHYFFNATITPGCIVSNYPGSLKLF